jgi:orotate phosphoribosyltransferase
MLQPHWLNRYAEIFWELYEKELPFQVAGMESAGIPFVSAIVMKSVERGTPVNGFFIRKSRKRKGLVKTIEGTLTNDKVILVDDLINSGQTLSKQADVLAAAGRRVSDIFVIVAYRKPDAYETLLAKGIALRHLFTIADFDLPLLRSHAPEVPTDSFSVLWRYRAPNPSYYNVVQKSTPAIDDARLYFGSDDGTFRALNLGSGAVEWEFRVGPHPFGKGIISSPALYEECVYFGAYDGTMYALERQSGKKRWVYNDADWIGSSPALAEDLGLLFIGLEFGLWKKRGGIAALDLRTGKEMWRDRTPSLTHGTPLYIREECLVVLGSNDGVVYAYDAKTGERRWVYQTNGDIKTAPAYDRNGGSSLPTQWMA